MEQKFSVFSKYWKFSLKFGDFSSKFENTFENLILSNKFDDFLKNQTKIWEFLM